MASTKKWQQCLIKVIDKDGGIAELCRIKADQVCESGVSAVLQKKRKNYVELG
jgi:hypothetical protein